MGNKVEGKFTWPPIVTSECASHDDDGDRSAVGFVEIKSKVKPDFASATSWSAFERTWFGLREPPLRERAIALGFTPDGPGEYCTRCGIGGTFGHGCGACEAEEMKWDRIVRIGEYDELPGIAARELKYERWRRVGADLGEWMGLQVMSELRRCGLEDADAILIPSPTHWLRRVWRGVDHTMVLANGASRSSGIPVRRWLARDFRLPQGGLGASARRKNVRGTMRWKGPSAFAELPQVLVVVDDVLTTGETMSEAASRVRVAIGLRRPVLVWGLVAGVAGNR